MTLKERQSLIYGSKSRNSSYLWEAKGGGINWKGTQESSLGGDKSVPDLGLSAGRIGIYTYKQEIEHLRSVLFPACKLYIRILPGEKPQFLTYITMS